MNSEENLQKEFKLEHHELADFLSDVADSIQDGEVALDGEDWKVYHEVHEEVPMRIVVDDEGLEIGVKLLRDGDQVN